MHTPSGGEAEETTIQKGLERLLEMGGLRRSSVVVAMAMWRLGEGGVGLKWEGWDAVASSAEIMEGMDLEAAELLERSMTALDGTVLDLARKGLTINGCWFCWACQSEERGRQLRQCRNCCRAQRG